MWDGSEGREGGRVCVSCVCEGGVSFACEGVLVVLWSTTVQ